MENINVMGKVVVESIDLESRDLKVLSKTPRGKDVHSTLHMWKVNGINSEDDAHNNRSDWTDLAVGDTIVFNGHMGNNGRIICTFALKYVPEDEEEVEAQIVKW